LPPARGWQGNNVVNAVPFQQWWASCAAHLADGWARAISTPGNTSSGSKSGGSVTGERGCAPGERSRSLIVTQP